jgi:hypothetical protein
MPPLMMMMMRRRTRTRMWRMKTTATRMPEINRVVAALVAAVAVAGAHLEVAAAALAGVDAAQLGVVVEARRCLLLCRLHWRHLRAI